MFQLEFFILSDIIMFALILAIILGNIKWFMPFFFVPFFIYGFMLGRELPTENSIKLGFYFQGWSFLTFLVLLFLSKDQVLHNDHGGLLFIPFFNLLFFSVIISISGIILGKTIYSNKSVSIKVDHFLRKSFYIFVALFPVTILGSVVLFACCHKRLESFGNVLTGSKKFLYISTNQDFIRVYDLEKKRLVSTIKVPDEQTHFEIKNMFNFEDMVILQSSKAIYEINDQNRINKLTETPSSLVSMDDKYFYLLDRTSKTSGPQYKTSRIDRSTGQIIDNHFDGDSNLIVREILGDNEFYWYACSGGDYLNSPVLVRKEILTGKIEKYYLAPKDYGANDITMIVDQEVVVLYYPTAIIKFSKSEKRVVKKSPAVLDYQNLLQHHLSEETNYFWVVQPSLVYLERVNKETGERSIVFPYSLTPLKNRRLVGSSFYGDKMSLSHLFLKTERF